MLGVSWLLVTERVCVSVRAKGPVWRRSIVCGKVHLIMCSAIIYITNLDFAMEFSF